MIWFAFAWWTLLVVVVTFFVLLGLTVLEWCRECWEGL